MLSWHRWTGAFLALFLLVQGLTGASLVFRDEIEPIVHPELRVAKGAERLPVQALYDSVAAFYPDAAIARAEFPESDAQAVLFKLKQKDAQRLAAVDPYTGRVVRAGGLLSWPFELLFDIHEQLLAGPVGQTLIGLEGLGLLFILVTGPIVWWPGRGRIRQGLRMRWRAKADLGSAAAAVVPPGTGTGRMPTPPVPDAGNTSATGVPFTITFRSVTPRSSTASPATVICPSVVSVRPAAGSVTSFGG